MSESTIRTWSVVLSVVAVVALSACGGSSKNRSVMDDDMTTDDMTTDDMTADDMTADDMTADDMTADDMTADDMTADDMTADDMTADDMTADDMTADDMTADDTTADDMTADDMTADDMTADDGSQLNRLVKKIDVYGSSALSAHCASCYADDSDNTIAENPGYGFSPIVAQIVYDGRGAERRSSEASCNPSTGPEL